MISLEVLTSLLSVLLPLTFAICVILNPTWPSAKWLAEAGLIAGVALWVVATSCVLFAPAIGAIILFGVSLGKILTGVSFRTAALLVLSLALTCVAMLLAQPPRVERLRIEEAAARMRLEFADREAGETVRFLVVWTHRSGSSVAVTSLQHEMSMPIDFAVSLNHGMNDGFRFEKLWNQIILESKAPWFELPAERPFFVVRPHDEVLLVLANTLTDLSDAPGPGRDLLSNIGADKNAKIRIAALVGDGFAPFKTEKRRSVFLNTVATLEALDFDLVVCSQHMSHPSSGARGFPWFTISSDGLHTYAIIEGNGAEMGLVRAESLRSHDEVDYGVYLGDLLAGRNASTAAALGLLLASAIAICTLTFLSRATLRAGLLEGADKSVGR